MLAVVGRVEVDVLPFDRISEALDEGVIGGAVPAIAADAAADGEQGLLVSEAGKLGSLVGIEEVGGRGAAQGRVEGLQAKADVERVRELPAEHIARVPVEHGGQIQKALGHGHVGNVDAPDLIRGGCRPVAQQVGIARDALPGYGEARLGVDRLVAHQAHEPTHPFLVHGVAGQAQVVAQAEHALEVVHRKLLVEQAHQFQVARTFATGLVVEVTARQPQSLAAGLHRTADRVRGLDPGPLLGRARRGSGFFNSAFSICSRPMAA